VKRVKFLEPEEARRNFDEIIKDGIESRGD